MSAFVPNRNPSTFKLFLLIILSVNFILFFWFPSPIPTIRKQSRTLKKQLNISYVEENFFSLNQDDPHLIQYARARYLTPPSKLEYNLQQKNGNFQDTFNGWVAHFFKNKREGIFIEAGAHDGEELSHTLYLEKELGWTGLLVECNPTVASSLISKRRKSWVARVCLSSTPNPGIVNFTYPVEWTGSGTIGKPWTGRLPKNGPWASFDVETIPLYTILAAWGWTEIDYFSFDIEGVELSVLRSFPFDKVIFRVLIIEDLYYDMKERLELNRLLESNGYIFVKKLAENDDLYIHKSMKDNL